MNTRSPIESIISSKVQEIPLIREKKDAKARYLTCNEKEKFEIDEEDAYISFYPGVSHNVKAGPRRFDTTAVF